MYLLFSSWLERKADGGLWLDRRGIESAELATDCILPGGTGITPAKELKTDETLLAQSAMVAFWSATASAPGRIIRQLAQNEGLETASACPGFMPSCLRPLLCKGNVPFCRAPSG